MGKFVGEVFFSNGRVEAMTRFKRYSYFPNRIFFSTNSGNYCMNSEGWFKCIEVFNIKDRVTEIEFVRVPISHIGLPVEDEGGDI